MVSFIIGFILGGIIIGGIVWILSAKYHCDIIDGLKVEIDAKKQALAAALRKP